MYNNAMKSLAEKYQLTKEEIDIVIPFVSERNQAILRKEWKTSRDFQKPSATEVRRAEADFEDAMGVLYLRNYEDFSQDYVKALGILVMSCFHIFNCHGPERRLFNQFDAEFIVLCIKTYLTKNERMILEARHGLDDGKKKSGQQIKDVTGLDYTRQWIYSLLKQAERKLYRKYYSQT